jgi:hypothetical protein
MPELTLRLTGELHHLKNFLGKAYNLKGLSWSAAQSRCKDSNESISLTEPHEVEVSGQLAIEGWGPPKVAITIIVDSTADDAKGGDYRLQVSMSGPREYQKEDLFEQFSENVLANLRSHFVSSGKTKCKRRNVNR